MLVCVLPEMFNLGEVLVGWLLLQRILQSYQEGKNIKAYHTFRASNAIPPLSNVTYLEALCCQFHSDQPKLQYCIHVV